MIIRTIALILDLAGDRPARNGESRLACGKNATLPLCSRLEMGDRVLFYDGTGRLCETIGYCTAAVCNYQGHAFRFDRAVAECLEALGGSDEEDELYLLGLTDKYHAGLSLGCEAAFAAFASRNRRCKPFQAHLWAVGPSADIDLSVNVYKVADASELKPGEITDAVFSGSGRGLRCTESGYFPLSV